MPDTKNPLKRVDVHAAPEPVSTGLVYQTPNSFGGAHGMAAALRAIIHEDATVEDALAQVRHPASVETDA